MVYYRPAGLFCLVLYLNLVGLLIPVRPDNPEEFLPDRINQWVRPSPQQLANKTESFRVTSYIYKRVGYPDIMVDILDMVPEKDLISSGFYVPGDHIWLNERFTFFNEPILQLNAMTPLVFAR